MIYLDTHAVAWLFLGRLTLLPRRVLARIERSEELRISPMVAVELDFMHELGRTDRPSREVLAVLGAGLGLRVCDLPFPAVAAAAAHLTWTRDPFDRLIVAQAVVAKAPLVTRDRSIHRHSAVAYWGD